MVLRLSAAKAEPAAPGAMEQGPPKQRRGESSDRKEKKEKPKVDKQMGNLMQAVLKSILRNFQDGRDVQSVVFDTALAESTLAEVEAAIEEAVQYNKQTHGVAGHGLGPPHLYVIGAFVDCLKDQIDEKAKTDPTAVPIATKLATLLTFLESATMEEKGRFIPFFKLTKCFKKRGETQKHRITFSFGPTKDAQDARDLLIKTLSSHSLVEFKVGRPPAGGLERDIQEWLETFMS